MRICGGQPTGCMFPKGRCRPLNAHVMVGSGPLRCVPVDISGVFYIHRPEGDLEVGAWMSEFATDDSTRRRSVWPALFAVRSLPRTSACTSLISSSSLVGVLCTRCSVLSRLRGSTPPPQSSHSFYPSAAMDYDAYDALLHHIFKQVSLQLSIFPILSLTPTLS